jgi:hypothetical protein
MVDAGLVPDPGTIVKQLEQEVQALASVPSSKCVRNSGGSAHGPATVRSG